VQLAQALLAVRIPLAMEADDLSRTSLGLVAAAYAAGFMGGAWLGPRLLARVGHIRVFSACAAIMAVSALALHAAELAASWMAVRVIAGASMALMFAAAESWMNSSIASRERGSVIGLYMVATKAAMAFGAFLGTGFASDAPEPFMIAAALVALAIAPVCFTTRAPPEPPKAEPLAIGALFRTAPAAVISSIGAGVVNAGVLALAPVYAAELFGEGSATLFYAAAWLGSLVLQWPAGRLSDRVDRRLVIAALSGLAAVSALALAALGPILPFWAAALIFASWGAGALSFYGIGVAHMADRSEPGQMARATAGLLFVWAAGSIAGPMLQGPIMDLTGVGGIFWFAGTALVVLTGAMVWRRQTREPPPPARKEPFQNQPATSIALAELAYGDADEPRAAPERPGDIAPP
jgi:MFS family permease